jgi:hypothetical protein
MYASSGRCADWHSMMQLLINPPSGAELLINPPSGAELLIIGAPDVVAPPWRMPGVAAVVHLG